MEGTTKSERPQCDSRRRAALVPGLATAMACVSLLFAACTDRVTDPNEGNAVVARGATTADLWQVRNSRLSYTGSISLAVEVRRKDSVSFVKRYSQLKQFRLTTSEITSQRLAIEPSALAFSLGVLREIAPTTGSATSSPAPIYRPTFGHPETHFLTHDGKDGSMQLVLDRSGQGKPASAALVYIEGRAVALFEFGYKRDGDKWKPTRTRTTLFAANGRVSGVVDQDLTNVAFNAEPTTGLLPSNIRTKLGLAGHRLLAIAQPDALYAAADYSSYCTSEYLAMVATIAAASYTAAQLVIAIAACPVTGIMCLAAVPAFAAHVIAAAAATAAVAAFNNCKSQHPCFDSSVNVPGPGLLGALHPSMECYEDPAIDDLYGDATSNGGGAPSGCEWMTMQISYDGGETWESYGDPFLVCDEMED